MYRHLVIDSERNMLLCNPPLVGIGELVDVYSLDQETPPQASGRLLRKVDEKTFEVYQSFDGHDALGRRYDLGERCVMRILLRNLSGAKRRKLPEEKLIMSTEKPEDFKDRKVVRAKTGSVRKRRKVEREQ